MSADLPVIYEDNHLLVVNKPAGVLIQPDHTGDESLLDMGKAYLKIRYNKPGNVFLGLVHRLDRPASGVVVFARTSKAAARLFDQFSQHTTRKIYLAVVRGETPAAGTLIHHIARKDETSHIVSPKSGQGQYAELSYVRKAYERGFSLVEIDLKTGRHHQIRVQFAHIGHPLAGDWRYGGQTGTFVPRNQLALHALSLTITHPTQNDERTFVAPPDGFWRSWLGSID